MRAPMILTLALGLAACSSSVPDSATGVGFEDYNAYLNGRTAAVVPTQPAPGGFSTDSALAAIEAAEAPVPGTSVRPRGNAPAGIVEDTGEMGAVIGGVSDEQDFAAVTARETIESDKARIERNRAIYTIDQPGALPTRTGTGGSAIVEFALATTHGPGIMMYQRSNLRLADPVRACARFPSPDLAQEAFLAAGGPERDSKSLDPDGDGYACAWDPRPFRTALQ